jgi:hypothetical protein
MRSALALQITSPHQLARANNRPVKIHCAFTGLEYHLSGGLLTTAKWRESGLNRAANAFKPGFGGNQGSCRESNANLGKLCTLRDPIAKIGAGRPIWKCFLECSDEFDRRARQSHGIDQRADIDRAFGKIHRIVGCRQFHFNHSAGPDDYRTALELQSAALNRARGPENR